MNSVLKITEPKPVCRKTTVQPVYFILLIYHICDIRLLNIITIFSLFDSLKLLQESGHHDLLLRIRRIHGVGTGSGIFVSSKEMCCAKLLRSSLPKDCTLT